MRHPSARAPLLMGSVVLSLVLGMSGVNAQASPSPGEGSGASPVPVRLVGLGDSIMTSHGCEGCSLFLDQYAAGLSGLIGQGVEADNLAIPGAEVAQVRQQVQVDPAVRDALAQADAVVITVGINDLPFNRLDDPCGVEARYPVIDWEGVTQACTDGVAAEYGRDLDALLSEIDGLRAGAPTLVRVTTVYDSVLGDTVDPSWNDPEAVEPAVYAVEAFYRGACDAAAAHDALCVDTYHALNGTTGREPAGPFLAPDYTHLGQAGHDAFAAVLLDTGVAPLQ
jgi:lysophospholipase L1-like esterase